ncbi:MAG: DUF1573 domain-containing protein [Candidatus Liptonbacteria bacterium]|nr:DUF1573 domain-containing protein [Candidatus Liptonbacteria bacterium]
MKTKNIITSIIIIAVILGVAIWIGKPASGPSQKANINSFGGNSVLSPDELSYDFGTISMAAGKVDHSFRIKNSGAEPITISQIYTSCMCTSATLILGEKRTGPFGMPGHGFLPKINKVIGPSGEAALEVVFDPAAHGPAGVGPIDRVVYLENNSGATLELGIKANVRP